MAAKTKAAEPPALDVVLAQMAEKRPVLGKLDDRLHDAIVRIENVLRTHLNMRVEHRVGGPPLDAVVLSFGKHKGNWCLLYETGSFSPPEFNQFSANHTVSLLQCSRELRAVMFVQGHLEKLLRASLQEIESQISQRERAVEQAEKLLEFIAPFESQGTGGSSDDDLPF